ncbi:MAG: winged helix-turn-helix domain-containing protein [Chloroflexota bacterium]
MQLPETSELLLPILKLLSNRREYRIREIANALTQELQLEQGVEYANLDMDAQFYSRVVGARSYLAHAKLIDNPKRGISVISARGEELLAEQPESLSLKSLTRYPEFIEYLKNSSSDQRISSTVALPDESQDVFTPHNGNGYGNGNGNHGAEADYAEEHENPVDDAEEVESAIHTLPLEPQQNKVTPYAPEGSVTSNGRIAIPVEFFEQIQFSSTQIQKPEKRAVPILVKDRVEPLSPSMFTILGAMRFFENFFQNFWLYLIPFALMMGAYAASFYILSDEFASRGVMFVQTETLIDQVATLGDDNINFFLTPSEQTAAEINELLNTDSFIRLIIKDTPLEAEMTAGDTAVRELIGDVRDAIELNVLGENNVEVKVTWDDREVAWKAASSTMNAYIDWKINSDKRDSFAAREFLEQLVPQYENEYRAAIQSLEEYLTQNPEPFRGERPDIETLQIEQLRTAIQVADERYRIASDNLEQIRLEEVIVEGKTRQAYTIVDSPSIPVEEEGGLTRQIIIGMVFVGLGVLLSFMAIVINTLLDRSIRFPIETPSTLGLPVLSSVSKIPNIDQRKGTG